MSRALKDYNSIDWCSWFYYDVTSKTGLRWKTNRYRGRGMHQLFRRIGDEAGNVQHNLSKDTKYASVCVNSGNYFSHRVIWIMHNGFLDNEFVVDHIDGNSLNNSIENLRIVKQTINNRNAALRKDNSTNVKGVNFTTATNHKGGVYTYVTASWHEIVNGKLKSICKHFSIHKYGLLPAFTMAVKHRDNQIKRLNNLGYGYTDLHKGSTT